MCCGVNVHDILGGSIFCLSFLLFSFNRLHVVRRLIIEVPVCSINRQLPTICIQTIYSPSTLSREHAAVFFTGSFFSGELGCDG